MNGYELPQHTYCSGCGATLYYGSEPEGALDTILRHSGKCPNCAKPLNFTAETVKIAPFPEGSAHMGEGTIQLDAAKRLLGRLLESDEASHAETVT